MYLPPIFKPRIMSPLNRGSCFFVPFPRGSAAARLHHRATIYRPRRGSDFGGHSSAGYPLKLPFGEFFEVPKVQFTK